MVFMQRLGCGSGGFAGFSTSEIKRNTRPTRRAPIVTKPPAVKLWLSLLACLWVVLPSHALAQGSDEDNAPRISLVTFGPGKEVHQYFGHNALIVSGGDLSEPAVYNYGMFGFGPGMIPKFLRGRLEFWVGVMALRPTFGSYVAANRDIRVIPLTVSAAQRWQIARELAHDASPEHRDYLYNHYDNNCSTRVRDVIDHALGGQLKRALSGPARFTLRQHTRRYTQRDPLIEWLMMFGLNDSVDQPITQWDEAFLPDELERLLMQVPPLGPAGQEAPFLGRRALLHDAKAAPPPETPATRWPWMLLMGVVNALLILRTGLRAIPGSSAKARWAFAIVHGQLALLIGLLGSLLLSLWLTDHLVAHANENLWMANPLPLLASLLSFGLVTPRARVEAILRGVWLTLAASTTLLLLLKVIVPSFDQDLSMTATLFAPINLAFAYTFWRRKRATI